MRPAGSASALIGELTSVAHAGRCTSFSGLTTSYLRLRRLSGFLTDRGHMTNFADVLTVLAAGGGLAVLLVMAAIPLLVDSHRPFDREEPARALMRRDS